MKMVEIIIDGRPYEIQVDESSKTSARKIFILGHKPESNLEDFELLKRMGDDEELIYSKNAEKGSLDGLIQVESNDSFVIRPYSESFTIKVDTREKLWNKREISYREVIDLSDDAPYNDNPDIVYTITYYKSLSSEARSLTRGNKVAVHDGMIFNVAKTDKS